MTTPTTHHLESQFEAAWPAEHWHNVHVVLAVSAGPDSVALLRAALALKSQAGGSGLLYVAHLNHRLRGGQADLDEAWLTDLCHRLNVPLEVGRADVPAIALAQGDGMEAAARQARHDFLRSAAERLGARFVVMAHTADDQVETVLHRIIRGSGLAGLTGIADARALSASVSLVRPLLNVERNEVLQYLAALRQDFRTDPSNVDTRYTRNRLRHDLLPLLREQYNPAVNAALLRLAAQAGEAQQWIADFADQLAQQGVAVEQDRIRIDRRVLSNQPPVVVRELCKNAWNRARWPLQAMGFDEWQQLAGLASQDQRATNLAGNIRAFRDGDYLILERRGLP